MKIARRDLPLFFRLFFVFSVLFFSPKLAGASGPGRIQPPYCDSAMEAQVHVIEPGDTLSQIAKDNRTTIRRIAEATNLVTQALPCLGLDTINDVNRLYVGGRIIVPVDNQPGFMEVGDVMKLTTTRYDNGEVVAELVYHQEADDPLTIMRSGSDSPFGPLIGIADVSIEEDIVVWAFMMPKDYEGTNLPNARWRLLGLIFNPETLFLEEIIHFR